MLNFPLKAIILQRVSFCFLTFLLQLLAVTLVKPRHLELWTLEAHGAVELHEAESDPHVEGIRQGLKNRGEQNLNYYS